MHVVIVGNGIAGISCALGIRDRDSTAQITVISGETTYFYSRTALMYAFMDKMKRQSLEPYERDVWKKRRIDLVKDWVIDLDARARSLKLKSGTVVRYDKLVLALGARPNTPAWPGLADVKSGIVNFVSIDDLNACEEAAKTAKKAVVVGGGLIGIELAECFVHHGLETTFLIREPYYWPASLSREESGIVIEHMRSHGLNVVVGDEVAMVGSYGGRVSDVTTKSGHTLNADVLGICIGVRANLDRTHGWMAQPEVGRGILVNERFETSLPDVYACGDCCEIKKPEGGSLVELIWYSAKRHGEIVARNVFGDAIAYKPPVFFNSSKFFEIEFTTVGDTEIAPAGTPTIYRKHRTKNITQRIVHNDGRVIGFNMLGSRWDNEVLARWITERRTPEYVLANLHEAQHDVEFGRARLHDFEQHDIPLAKLNA